jgi:hypothetical protein
MPAPARSEPVGEAENDVVGPHFGLERPSTLHIGVVARKAELVIGERRNAWPDMILQAHQTFDRNACELILESSNIRSSALDLDMRKRGTNTCRSSRRRRRFFLDFLNLAQGLYR